MTNRFSNRYLPYLFMLPAILILLFVYICPFFSSIYISMTDWNGISWAMNFIGFKNFIDILNEPSIGEILLNNLKYFLVLVFVQNFAAVIFAVLIDSVIAGRNFFRAVFFMPTIVATVAIGFIWTLMLDPVNGSIPNMADKLGITFLSGVQWLGDPNVTLFVIAFVSMWQWTGWNMVIYIAGLQSIPKDLYESSDIDGASGLSKFRHITIPMLAPAITVNMVMSTIGVLKFFDMPFIMTKGGPGHSTETLAITIYNNAFLINKMGYGTAISLVLFILVLAITIFQTMYFRRAEEDIN